MSNIQVKKICAECSTPLPHFRVFYDKSAFFSRKDVRRISIRSSASSVLGAARATMTLTCSNIQRKIRALGLIPSNIQVNYQFLIEPWTQNSNLQVDSVEPSGHLPITNTEMVNALESEQILPSHVSICPQSWALVGMYLGKPLHISGVGVECCK